MILHIKMLEEITSYEFLGRLSFSMFCKTTIMHQYVLC
jgi:hypothetical protein